MFLFGAISASAQMNKDSKLEKNIEAFRLGLISGKRTDLNPLVSETLSYGHSGGKIENKEAFLKQLETGASDFVKIEFLDQNIQINGKVAIVRHLLMADIMDGAVPASIKLHVLMVWQKEQRKWKLIARQAVRI